MNNNVSFEENLQLQQIQDMADKVGIIVKRVILGIIIAILGIFILFDLLIVGQTIKARNYIDTTATYTGESKPEDDKVIDYTYSFIDKNGKEQKITLAEFNGDEVKKEIKIKYDENNPQKFYEESAVLDTKGIIWFILEVVIQVLLIILFCNKNLLRKIHLSGRVSN